MEGSSEFRLGDGFVSPSMQLPVRSPGCVMLCGRHRSVACMKR